jgi:hypothetical protein
MSVNIEVADGYVPNYHYNQVLQALTEYHH